MIAARPRAEPLGRFGIYGLLLVLIVFAALYVEEFRTAANLANVLKQTAALGILALGQSFVIIGGMLDLSVGQLLGLVVVLVTPAPMLAHLLKARLSRELGRERGGGAPAARDQRDRARGPRHHDAG